MGSTTSEESISELFSVLWCLMQQQSDREVRTEQVSKQQEGRWKRTQRQFAQLQRKVREDYQMLL